MVPPESPATTHKRHVKDSPTKVCMQCLMRNAIGDTFKCLRRFLSSLTVDHLFVLCHNWTCQKVCRKTELVVWKIASGCWKHRQISRDY